MEVLQKKIARINQWQWLCFLPGIVFMVTGGKPIDAQHARSAAIFRLTCIIIGLLVFVVFQIVKVRYKQQLQMLEAIHQQELNREAEDLEGQQTSVAARKS